MVYAQIHKQMSLQAYEGVWVFEKPMEFIGGYSGKKDRRN